MLDPLINWSVHHWPELVILWVLGYAVIKGKNAKWGE